MNILLFSNTGLAPIHLGIELEIVEKALKEGHSINIIKCDNKLEGCYFNPCHNLIGCSICEARGDVFYKSIGIPKENIFRMANYPIIDEIEFPFFETTTELINYNYDEINIGRGVASSIISIRRNHEISSYNEKDFIEFQLKMAINVYLNFKNFISKTNPDCIYIFNGRFAESFPIVEYAIKRKIKYKTIEVARSKHRYDIYDNNLPHDLEARFKKIEETWSNGIPAERDKIAIEWFEKTRNGTKDIGINFIKNQTQNTLPKNFDPKKENIAIFNSSEDEMKVMKDRITHLYKSQNDAIEKVVNHFSSNKDIHFYLRVHPNLGVVNNSQMEGILKMNYPNLTVISPESDIDTYALMDVCDKTFTFGSSVGIEATYWGKPSILFGRTIYEQLDTVYFPKTYEMLYDLLLTKDLKPKEKSSTYKFSYYISSFGKPYLKFKYDGKFNSTYGTKKMKRFYPRTIYYLLKYLPNFKKWVRYNKIIRRKSFLRSNLMKLR